MKYIGIIGRNDEFTKFNQEVINVIYKYNCVPIGIIVDFEGNSKSAFEKVKKIIDLCDGFILQGGTDYYDIDILIVKYLYNRDIPVLGICLGMQTMAMSFNGEMSHISNHLSDKLYVHGINIDKNSFLYEIMGTDNILVNSRHKDYIIKTSLDVSGSFDIIEAVEDKNKRFFVGVQWHPESLMDKYSLLLFDKFFKSVD